MKFTSWGSGVSLLTERNYVFMIGGHEGWIYSPRSQLYIGIRRII